MTGPFQDLFRFWATLGLSFFLSGHPGRESNSRSCCRDRKEELACERQISQMDGRRMAQEGNTLSEK